MSTDWLRYANQGATRSLPLSPQLMGALGFLPEMGVQMEVFSGGQPAKGSGLARVGSVRHDHGNAADVFFYKDGRKLDWSNPNDQPVFEEIVKRSKAAGVTGFGAGPGYMQPGSMHIGFGNPGVWGAGGKGANAPSWLSAAYNGAQAGKTPDVIAEVLAAGQGQPTQLSQFADGPKGQEMYTPVMGSPPAMPQTMVAGATPTMPTSLPSVSPTGGMADIFGMLGGMQSQPTQFSDGRVMGPTAEQATGLAQLVEALKSRMI